MRVDQIMTAHVHLMNPDQTVSEAVRKMEQEDLGFLPVGTSDRLVGIITDRDIALRVIGKGRDGNARIGDVMSGDVKYCYCDQEVEEVVANMGDIQVRRLPVVDRDKRLVGVVSLADAALKQDASLAGEALSDIAEPGGQHNQAKSEAVQKK
jgi:CBS domain-containing protein